MLFNVGSCGLRPFRNENYRPGQAKTIAACGTEGTQTTDSVVALRWLRRHPHVWVDTGSVLEPQRAI